MTISIYEEKENRRDELESKLLNRLGFCGCGLPDDCLIFIHDLLLLRSNLMNSPRSGPGWRISCDEFHKKQSELFSNNPDELKYIVYYLLDSKGITDHGSSASSCWINDHKFLDELNEWRHLFLDGKE